MRNVLIVVALIGFMIFGINKMRGRGTLVIVGPSDRSVSVSVEGKNRVIGSDQVERIAVKRGKHQVSIVDGPDYRTREVEVLNADDTVFMPISDGACYVLLDMSGSYVNKREASPQNQVRPPTVVARLKDAQTYRVPEETYFMRVPKETYSDQVHYVRAVSCKTLDLGDEQVIAEALVTMKVGR